MPGNRVIYQQAIRKAHSSAWDKKWLKAIDEYHRALQEFPDDFDALVSLAMALEEAGQLESALHECQRAARINPQEVAVLTRLAGLQEKLARNEDAVATYLKIADAQIANRSRGKAVEAWHKAAALAPDRLDVHEQLAGIYEKAAHHSLAAREHLALAKIYSKNGDHLRAAQASQRALELDPRSPAINEWVRSMREATQSAEAAASSPVNQAQQAALLRLADTLLDDRSPVSKPSAIAPEISLTKPEIDALVARAIDAQTHGRVADAITSYRKLISGGVTRNEVRFNLGLLYSETMRYDEATRLLRETAMDPAYALASHYELGKCYRILGNLDKSLEHFLAVTKLVDLGSVQREQADELISVYQELISSYTVNGNHKKAEETNQALQEFLVSRGWADKVDQVRTRVETVQEKDQENLGEADSTETSRVLKALSLAQEYLRRGKTYAAGEECLLAIELAPSYLPAHVRLAEVYVKEGRIDAAKEKYQTMADLSLARGDFERAEGFYRQLVKIVPDDVMVRSKLIDISLKQGRNEDVIEQYLELGEDYAKKGDYTKASEKYSEGLRVAERAKLTSHNVAVLQHRYAEALVKLNDFRRALATYQDIKQHYPEDERARLMTIDLRMRMGQMAPALQDLDEMNRNYQGRGEHRKVTSLLQDLVQNYPDDSDLRDRLASAYILAGETQLAISALDALGELQLSKGQRPEAAATIQRIISLNPPRLDDYRQLLSQINGDAS